MRTLKGRLNPETIFSTERPPVDAKGRHHSCQDETATVVNDCWYCCCPGGPYYFTEAARRAARA